MDFPNLRHLRVFLRALDRQSISVAADLEHVTQPAASQGIAKLERILQADLMIRRSGTVLATEAGEVFAKRVRRAIGLLDRGAEAAQKTAAMRLASKMTGAQLRALIAVSDAGSFTVGAKNLELAQPSVHRRARSLEDLAGVPLFRAAASGVTLTAAGQALCQMAKLARTELRQGQEEVSVLVGKGAGSFVLGSLPLARSQVIPRAIDAVLRQTNDLQVQVVDGRYGELLRGLREGEIDALIGALRQPSPAEDVVQEPLFADGLAVVCRAGHPLAERAAVSLKDTLVFPWIAPPKSTPSGQYLFDVMEIGTRTKTPVRVVSSSLVLVRQLLLQGDYVSILSHQQIAQDILDERLVELPLHLPPSHRDIGLTLRRSWEPTHAQSVVLTALRHASQNS